MRIIDIVQIGLGMSLGVFLMLIIGMIAHESYRNNKKQD